MGRIETRWHAKKTLDVSKMNDLGWTAKINIESGIKLTIESFKNEFRKILYDSKKIIQIEYV